MAKRLIVLFAVIFTLLMTAREMYYATMYHEAVCVITSAEPAHVYLTADVKPRSVVNGREKALNYGKAYYYVIRATYRYGAEGDHHIIDHYTEEWVRDEILDRIRPGNSTIRCLHNSVNNIVRLP